MDIGAFALEQLVAPYREKDIEVARRPAACASLAFAGEADARAVLDTGGNIDLQNLVAPHTALAATRPARLVDDLAGAMAGMACTFDRKETLLRPDSTTPLAGGACLRLGARFRTAAVADLARHGTRHPHRGFSAAISLFERDFEIEAQVLAACIGTSAASAAAATEHLVEDIAEHRAEIETLALRTAGTGAAFKGCCAVAVIGGALFRILQDVVGVVDGLELLFGFRIPRIAVRMELHGELAKRLLDVIGARRTADSEQLVIVLRHPPYAAPSCLSCVGLPLAREAAIYCSSSRLSRRHPSSCSCR